MALVVLCLAGLLLSFLAYRWPERYAESPRFHAAVAVPAAALWGWWGASISAEGPAGAYTAGLTMAVPPLCWAFFGAKTAGFYLLERIVPAWTGAAKVDVEPSFDKAEALERRGDLEGALREYLRAVEARPKGWQARARLAELLLRTGQRQKGEAELRRASDLAKEPHARAPLVFRLSDLRRDAGDLEAARRILKMFLAQEPPEPYHAHAVERLSRL